jgi:hypothetical protein
MAQKMITTMVDDLDGSDADETVTFALDGQSYELDLSAKNAAALRKSLDRYREAARSTGRRRASGATSKRPRTKAPRAGADVDPKMVRAWAKQRGLEVSKRGRISSGLLEQYKASGNS